MTKAELRKLSQDAAMSLMESQTALPVLALAKKLTEAQKAHKEDMNKWAEQSKEMATLIKAQTDTIAKYEKMYVKLADQEAEIVVQEAVKRIPKQKDGKDGVSGRDGRDGKTPSSKEIANMVISMIRQPRDGKDAILDKDEIIEGLIKALKDDKKFKWKDIPGLENEIASYRNQLAGKVYGKDTWARGGGDTVSAGSNITLVRKADGTVEINASGGGSGTNVTTQYRLSAVQVGNDVTIDLTQLTNWATFTDFIQLVYNNMPQTEDLNFTVVGSTLTVFNAFTSDTFNVTYAYS